ncbi:asparaginase [Hymenobacter chitinivorans]|uniref:asparaginase n=1 Tax=Hymenobacter chitinivorans DSM 11115 TaxID=1121954 RepID=A0A2M9BNR4_9BACT|nr:type I asparaginase [Hymenobacter chitinivorans]PJJ59589.1 L-asparaginase [Hymenobacter chitinivorans DSM 11115]
MSVTLPLVDITPAGHGARPATSVLVIYTGGTVGMEYNRRGELVPMKFERIRKKMPELRQLNMNLSVLSLPQIIDSSNVTASDWLGLAAIIEENYAQYDGFVVLHGTDTMAYSAAALSYLLENLGKPVVFTGSQVPVGRIRTDARRNLLTALDIAAARHPKAGTVRVPEVCVFFNDLLIRGNRAKKVESQQYNAFRSENYPPLARAGIEVEFNDQQVRHLPSARLRVHRHLDEQVVILKLFPGITERVVRAVLEVEGLRGCVLETYGSGNAPTAPWFLRCLGDAHARGVQILNVSQCEEGRVIQGQYETSSQLTDLGVIGGEDITAEAAITKLMFVLGLGLAPHETARLLAQDLRGEISLG